MYPEAELCLGSPGKLPVQGLETAQPGTGMRPRRCGHFLQVPQAGL